MQKMILPRSILIIFLVVGLFIFKKSQVAIKRKEIERVQETKPVTIEPAFAFPSVAEGELKSDEKPLKGLKSEIPVKVKKVVPKVEETKPTIQEPSVIPALTVVQSETPVDSSFHAAAGKQFAGKTTEVPLRGKGESR
jgi:hypothetical protein